MEMRGKLEIVCEFSHCRLRKKPELKLSFQFLETLLYLWQSTMGKRKSIPVMTLFGIFDLVKNKSPMALDNKI